MTQFLLPELLEQCCDQAPPSRSLPAAFRTADARILGPVVPGVVFWSSVVPYVDATALSHDHYTAAVHTVRFHIRLRRRQAARRLLVPVGAAGGVVAQPEVLSQLDPALQDALRSAAAQSAELSTDGNRVLGQGEQRVPVREGTTSTDYNFVAMSQLRAWTGGLRKLTLQYLDPNDGFHDALLYLFRSTCRGTETLECLTLRTAPTSPDLVFCVAESCLRLRHLSLLNCFSHGTAMCPELNALTVRAVARAQWRGLKTLTITGRYSRHVLLSQLFLHCCAEELRHRTGFCGNVIIPPQLPSMPSPSDDKVLTESPNTRDARGSDNATKQTSVMAPVPLYKSLTVLATGTQHMTLNRPLPFSDIQRLVLACPSLRAVVYGLDRLTTTDAPRTVDWHTYNAPLYAELETVALKRQARCDVVRRGKGKPSLAEQQKDTTAPTKAADGSSFYSWRSEMQATGQVTKQPTHTLLPFLELPAKRCLNLSRPEVRSRGRAAIRAAVNGPLPPHDVLLAHSVKLQRVVREMYITEGQHSKRDATASFDTHSSDIADILSRESCELFDRHGLVSPQLPLLQSELQELRKAEHLALNRRREARLSAKLHARSSGVWGGLQLGEVHVEKEAMAALSALDVGGPLEALTSGHHNTLTGTDDFPVRNMLIE